MDNSQKIAIVNGDLTIDWNIAHIQRSSGERLAWTTEECTRAYFQPGGAGLSADLIRYVAQELRRQEKAHYEVRQMATPGEAVCPGDERFHHSYAIWSPFDYSIRSSGDKVPKAWRVAEFLGLDRCAAHPRADSADWRRVVNDSAEADLVVLDDANLGFRGRRELWPQAIADGSPWIVLKMASPVLQGELWEHLHRNCAGRLIVVTTINDLRLADVQISRALSWERTAQDLFWELVHNPRVNGFSKCTHVVITFGAAGAVLLSRSQNGSQAAEEGLVSECRLFFDPKVIEGMWEQDHPGSMIGYTSCLIAGICRELMLRPKQPDIHHGTQRGLAALRVLHLEGYARGSASPPENLSFPYELIAAELAKEGTPFAIAPVPSPARLQRSAATPAKIPRAGRWTILQDRYKDNHLGKLAQQIVLEGADIALHDVPIGQFGHLLTVDRQEIESFRSIRVLVAEYCRGGSENRPLSIAVFGPPGSGKSFGITEVASSLLCGEIKVLEFNLSQFSAPRELLAAFHQVRDVGLSGKTPLVFWDEFDSTLDGKALGWLRYFLAPMQDGGFQEGQIVHPLGHCIFVFAGGTSTGMESFGDGLSADEFGAAKGTDFISRLRGYINILGPNPQATDVGADPYYSVRRAILLRSLLERRAPQLLQTRDAKQALNIDKGVLRAFLETRAFRHGVRSMEAIIAMSLLKGESRFERSSLPAQDQLNLHVDGEDFLALIQQAELEGELLEKLAEAAHEVFCEGLRAKGYCLGAQTSEALKTHNALKPYAELPEEEKEQNRGNVRDMPNKLVCIGYVMLPARESEVPVEFDGDHFRELVEKLAEMEHNRWMKAKIAAGSRWAEETDKQKRLHKDLLPWRRLAEGEMIPGFSPAEMAAIGPGELPEAEKDKDRDLVRGIPSILAKAGYTVAKNKEEEEHRSSVANA